MAGIDSNQSIRVMQTKLSTLGSVVLCLGVAFAFSLMLVGGGYMAQQQERQKLADFASDSAAGTGIVARKFTEVMTGNTLYYNIEASFAAPDGSRHKQSFRIPPAVYNQYSVGGSIPVTYVKSKPYLFHIPGAQPDEVNLQIISMIGKWSFVASIVLGVGFLIGLGIALISRWSAGGDAAAPPARIAFGTKQARR